MGPIAALPRPRRPKQIPRRALTYRTGGRAGGSDRLNHHLEESHDVVRHFHGLGLWRPPLGRNVDETQTCRQASQSIWQSAAHFRQKHRDRTGELSRREVSGVIALNLTVFGLAAANPSRQRLIVPSTPMVSSMSWIAWPSDRGRRTMCASTTVPNSWCTP